MSIISHVVGWFVKDAAERKRFLQTFNQFAQDSFQCSFVDTLAGVCVCEGNPDPSFRHDLSAPRVVSGLVIQAKGGVELPVDEILAVGRIVLSAQAIVRRMYVLHWDTLYVTDIRTGKSVCWRIKDFLYFGGLLH